MIVIGTELSATIQGRPVHYRIVAIRHAPFDYVELEPVGGGPRRALPMYLAERMPTTGSPDTDAGAVRLPTSAESVSAAAEPGI